jgi:hypothetical protein
LTKPFSSIRRLIDRVGALVSSSPVEKEAATAELPKPEGEPAEEPQLSTQELELTTADTLPLAGHPFADSLPRVEPVVSDSKPAESVTPSARLEAVLSEMQSSESSAEVTSEHEGSMEPGNTETHLGESQPEAEDVLLDLGGLETTRAAASDDFVLDLDDDRESSPVYNAAPANEPAPAYELTTYEATPAYETAAAWDATPAYEPEPSYEPAPMRAFVEPEVTEATQTYEAVSVPPELTPDPVPVFGESEFPTADTHRAAAPGSSDRAVNLDQLSPEMIDAIARRAVELMSDKVIREIAWEVVPDLAELLIKRQLEERSAK